MAKPRRHIHLHREGDIAVGVSITPDAAAKPTPSGGLAFGVEIQAAGMDSERSATPADPGNRSQSQPPSSDGLSDPPSPP